MVSETFGGFMNFLVWLIPLPPLLAFFVIILFTNKNKALSHSIAVGAAVFPGWGAWLIFIRAVGVEEFGKHIFESVNQLAANREYLVQDWCAD